MATLALAQHDVWYAIVSFLSLQEAWPMLYVCRASRAAFLSNRGTYEHYRHWLARLLHVAGLTTKCTYSVLAARRNEAIDFNTLYTLPTLSIPGYAYYLGSDNPRMPTKNNRTGFDTGWAYLVLERPLCDHDAALLTAMYARVYHPVPHNANLAEQLFRLFTRGILVVSMMCRHWGWVAPYFVHSCVISRVDFCSYRPLLEAQLCEMGDHDVPKRFRRRCRASFG